MDAQLVLRRLAEQGLRLGNGLPFQCAAANRPVKSQRRDDNARTRFPWRGPFNLHHRNHGAGAMRFQCFGDSGPRPSCLHPFHRPQNGFGRCRCGQFWNDPRLQAANRIGNGAPHGNRQHQRRLAHRLGTVNRIRRVAAAFIKLHPEIGGHIRGAGNFVGGWRMGAQAAPCRQTPVPRW